MIYEEHPDRQSLAWGNFSNPGSRAGLRHLERIG